MQVERELKFNLPAPAARRAMRLLPFSRRVRRQRLHSIYFDTPDLRLQRAGVALRLRRAGGRWLQALKAPQGAQSALAIRAEWEIQAPRGRLDCRLFPREAIRAATGIDIVRVARRLRPVFITDFERRSAELALGHGIRAAACLDLGAIEAGQARAPLCELELELSQGEIGPLIGLAEKLIEPLGLQVEIASKAERGYRLYRSSGQSPPAKWTPPAIAENAAASDAFASLFSAALAQIGANAAGVARGRDPEYLHQLRVGVRRLRSALRAFRPLLKRSGAKTAERPLRRMMRTFGAARDWDVFCDSLAGDGGVREMLARARRRRSFARREARRLIAGAAFQRAQLRALRWLHGNPWKTDAARAAAFSRFAANALEQLHARVSKRAHHIDWRNAKRRHAVRIEVKRLRYGCDFFAGCFAYQAVRPFLARLASLQDTLGELNDIAVARSFIDELAPRGAPATSGREAARLRRGLGARERELITSLELAWRGFALKRPFWQPKPRAQSRG